MVPGVDLLQPLSPHGLAGAGLCMEDEGRILDHVLDCSVSGLCFVCPASFPFPSYHYL